MEATPDELPADAESLLHLRQILDIDAYGWNADEIDDDFQGYAMWVLNPPYEQDFDAFQRDRRPERAPTDYETGLTELGHDFIGLMKTSRHFIGQALTHLRTATPMRTESSPFEFDEFAALAALVAAADRLRDFLIVMVLGSKTDETNQLDLAYAALSARGFGTKADMLRDLAREFNRDLRAARNTALHGLSTRSAQVQRQMINMDKRAHETGGWNKVPMSFEEVTYQAHDTDGRERTAIQERARLLCHWYVCLVKVGDRTFRLEYAWREQSAKQI